MTQRTGGPAFPTAHDDQGMTLRDYFAGQSLAGINSNTTWDENGWSDRATSAYAAADAMLEARK